MKKFLTLALVLLFFGSMMVIGCGKQEAEDTTTQQKAEEGAGQMEKAMDTAQQMMEEAVDTTQQMMEGMVDSSQKMLEQAADTAQKVMKEMTKEPAGH